tara:strand:+ start:804 stop:1016 length:213 start_codon:yes stop_codon:yes gene_type:complete
MPLNLPDTNDPNMQTSKKLLEEEDKKNQKTDKNYLITGGVNIILQSANGTYYKIEVDNSGNLSTSSTTLL